MKVILKMQQGGGMPPFVSYIPIASPAVPPSYTALTSDELKQTSLGLLDKDMMKLLYEQGIPSDVEAFIDKAGIFSNNLFNSPFSKDNAMIQYKTILKMLPRIKAENDRFQSAMKSAEANQGLGEIAVTERGDIFIVDDEGKISIQNLQNIKNFNNLHILTNAELANYRANNVQAAFNTNITSIIGNAVGIPKITEYLKSVIDKLGTMSMSKEGYVGQQSNKIVKGLEYLIAADAKLSDLTGMSIDGLYKVKNLDKNQLQQANYALNYLINTLPTNMKAVLQVKSGLFLNDASLNGVKKLVASLIASVISGDHQLGLDLQEKLNSKGELQNSSEKSNNIIDPVKAFVLGLGEQRYYKVNNGTAFNANLLGTSAPIVDISGKTIGIGTLEDVARSTFSQALDLRNATMGNELINSTQRDRVAIDGSNVISVDLPLDLEAATTGIIKPDITSLNRIESAELEIRDKHITSELEINTIYEKYKLPFKYNNGNINTNAYHRFAVLDGQADESAFKKSVDLNELVTEINDENEKSALESILKKQDLKFKLGHAYAGSVYIPIRENIINAAMGSGHYPTLLGNNANELDAKEKLADRLKRYVATGPLSILQKQ